MAPEDIRHATKALLRALSHGGGRKCLEAGSTFQYAAMMHHPLRMWMISDGVIDAFAGHANDKQSIGLVIATALQALALLSEAGDEHVRQQVVSNVQVLRWVVRVA